MRIPSVRAVAKVLKTAVYVGSFAPTSTLIDNSGAADFKVRYKGGYKLQEENRFLLTGKLLVKSKKAPATRLVRN